MLGSAHFPSSFGNPAPGFSSCISLQFTDCLCLRLLCFFCLFFFLSCSRSLQGEFVVCYRPIRHGWVRIVGLFAEKTLPDMFSIKLYIPSKCLFSSHGVDILSLRLHSLVLDFDSSFTLIPFRSSCIILNLESLLTAPCHFSAGTRDLDGRHPP